MIVPAPDRHPDDRPNRQLEGQTRDSDVLPEEAVQALIKLALLLRDIRARQAAERPFTRPNTHNHHDGPKTGGEAPAA